MANQTQLDLLRQSRDDWNEWRRSHPDTRPDLTGADLKQADLMGADLTAAILDGALMNSAHLSGAILHKASLVGSDLTGANLYRANLAGACLCGANLQGADLSQAVLEGAQLKGAILRRAQLWGAILYGANLQHADLYEADLRVANLIEADLSHADLTGCRVYGVSAWKLKVDGTKQQNLMVSAPHEPEITVDNIEVAQFFHLLLHNRKVRDVIDTITSKAVLLLGRFTPDRRNVLDALRSELRQRNYLPILFDFDVPRSRDITETVSLLARLSRFVIADITDASSIPQELSMIVPDLPSVPVQPLLLEGSNEYSMFEHFRRYPWVLEIVRYESPERLIADLGEHVIRPAEAKAKELHRARLK